MRTNYQYLEDGSILKTEQVGGDSIRSFLPVMPGTNQYNKIVNCGAEIKPFINPDISIQDKINELESDQTPRMLRGVALGDADSIAKLQAIETEIAELRKQL